jgi:hypothetical protein
VTPPAATVAGRHSTGMRPASRSSRVAPRPSAPPRRRPAAVPRPARRPDLPLAQRALAWLRALPDHRLLDRLIGGRIWIVLLGTLLVGIVTLQLSLLRLNAGIGQAVQRTSALEQRNAALRLSISRLSDSERIVALAAQIGFVMPPQGSPRFLTAGAGDGAKALSTMRVPDPTAAATAAAQLTAAPSAAVTDTTATALAPSGTTTTAGEPAATGTGVTAGVGTSTGAGTTTAPTAPTGTSGATTAPAAPAAPASGTTAPAAGATPSATPAPPPVVTAGGASAGVVGSQG